MIMVQLVTLSEPPFLYLCDGQDDILWSWGTRLVLLGWWQSHPGL